MLPPVSAVAAADLSFQPNSLRQDDPATTTPVSLLRPVAQEAATTGASATVRAVSGEVSLSQNVSVLAETLGKLMKIERMDGETAEAYVNRLVTSMQSLPAGEKATLEKQLGNILRDINLSMLASILKNASGPEAARMAVMFEFARPGNGTAAAKVITSSYLQDLAPEVTEAPLAPSRATPSAPVSPASSVVLGNSSAGGETKSALPLNAKGYLLTGTQAAPQDADGSDQPLAAPTTTMPSSGSAAPIKDAATLPTPELPNRPLNPAASAQSPSQTMPAEGYEEPAELLFYRQTAQETTVSRSADLLQGQAQPQRETPGTKTGLTASAGSTPNPTVETKVSEAKPASPQPTPQTQSPQATIPQMATGAAPPALAAQFSAATPKEMEALLLAVLLEKLPSQAESEAELQPQQLAPLPQPRTDSETEHMARPHQVASQASSHAASAQTADEAMEQSSLNPQVAATQRAATAASDAETAILNQPSLHSAVASLIGKEGTALPFVNYPAAKDEYPSDAPPRGRWPSSEGGSGEQDDSGEHAQHSQGESEQGSEQEERTAANDEPVDHSVSEGANDDGSIGNAEYYYLRMSGFS